MPQGWHKTEFVSITAHNAQSPLDEPAEWGGKSLRAA